MTSRRAERGLSVAAIAVSAATFGLAACGTSAPASEHAAAGHGAGGSGATSAGGAGGGTSNAGRGGGVASAGADSAVSGGGAGATGTAASGAGGGVPAGGTAAAGSPTTGGTAAGGAAAGGAAADVGSEGDGDSKLGPSYTNQKELTNQGKPAGKSFSFAMPLAQSKLFDGKAPTLTRPASTTRTINVYVPAKYQDGTPAPVLVIQDGPGQLTQVARALDNLTVETDATRRLPAFVVVAVANGGDDSIGSERGLEYDTMSDKYARFVETEVFPAVLSDAKIKAAYPGLAFTTDPSGRAALGCSSGAVAAFTMAWFRPDLFSRVIGYSTTLVAQQDPKAAEAATYPDGAWDYHSIKELIKNDAEGREKKLRIFINANENDNGATAAASGMHNWLMGNTRTAAALAAKGFHYKFIEGLGESHCSGAVQSASLADALIWAWRGYQSSGK